MPSVPLSSGAIHYEKSGPSDGRPVVFIHGYAMGASLWRPLSERLSAQGLSCFAPTWPLGAHAEPMRKDAELTMEGVAATVGEFLDSLELQDVVLVGNDTGGALAQILATTNAGRLGALVLTSCDAFEHFPPPILKPFIAAAKAGPAFTAALQPLRTRFGRQRAYGALAHTDIDGLAAEWLKPALGDERIRADLRRFTASLSRQSTVNAGERLPQFTRPALVAWSAEDAFFPLADGERLAAALPDARFEVLQKSRTFSMLDQPDALAELIAELAGVRLVDAPSG
ncbi:MAG TPA: alpha/beta hydrolase [Solirubrobacteraceae bacterium]|nr:alpha/beta hydrolase [Solirubrobacteraceae bacterium]